jgi:hypothetical protein
MAPTTRAQRIALNGPWNAIAPVHTPEQTPMQARREVASIALQARGASGSDFRNARRHRGVPDRSGAGSA